LREIKLLSSSWYFYLLHSDVKNVLEGMKVAKIQHSTSLFHSKKRHSTSCLGTCKVHLLVFFRAIDSFCCLTLIWVHLLLCLLLLMCWPMVGNALALCIWKMFHLHPLYVFYILFFEGCHHFPTFPTSMLYPCLFKERIPNNYQFKLIFSVLGQLIIQCVYWV
jgi:hypothetical protein